MKNTIGDLNNYLFETLERLMDDDLTEDQLKREISRSKAVTAVASTIIRSGEASVKAARLKMEYGKDASLPALMEGSAK